MLAFRRINLNKLKRYFELMKNEPNSNSARRVLEAVEFENHIVDEGWLK
jgi:hypothetical protein